MNWKERQKDCPRCQGVGYVNSEARHSNGRQPHAWAVRCECQPTTLEELAEAAEQEKSEGGERGGEARSGTMYRLAYHRPFVR